MSTGFYLYVHPDEHEHDALKGLAYVMRFLSDIMHAHIDSTDGRPFTLSALGIEGLAILLLSLEEGLHEIADRAPRGHCPHTKDVPGP